MDANVSPLGESKGGTSDANGNSRMRGAARGGGGSRGGRGRGLGRGRGASFARDGVGGFFKSLVGRKTPGAELMDTRDGDASDSEGQGSGDDAAGSDSVAAHAGGTDQVSQNAGSAVPTATEGKGPSSFTDGPRDGTAMGGTKGAEDPGSLGASDPLRAWVAECVRECEHQVPEELFERMVAALSGEDSGQACVEAGREVALGKVRAMLAQRQEVCVEIASTLTANEVPTNAARVAAVLAALPQLKEVGSNGAAAVGQVRSTLSTLNWAGLEERKAANGSQHGNSIYRKVAVNYPYLAGKITGLLLELYDFEISHLLADSLAWDAWVADAISALHKQSLGLEEQGPAAHTEGQQGMDCDDDKAAGPEAASPQVGLAVCTPVQLAADDEWLLCDKDGQAVLTFPEGSTVGDLVNGGLVPWRKDGGEAMPYRVLRVVHQGVDQGDGMALSPGEVLLCLTQSGDLAGVAEDEPDPSAIPYTHIEQALRWTIRSTPNIQRGCALEVLGDQVSVLIGENKVVSVKNRQQAGPQVGEPLYLRKRTTILPSDELEVEYVMVRPPTDVQELELPVPQLRAVVQEYEARQGVVWGRALVPATGSRVSFQATKEYGPASLPAESVFLFCPTFAEDEKGYMRPVLADVKTVKVTHKAVARDGDDLHQGQDQEVREFHSHTELVPGFYSLGEKMMGALALEFGVEGTPFEGEDLSYADYCGGGELLRHLLAEKGQGGSIYDLSLKEIQDAMIKVDSCRRASTMNPVSEEDTQALLDRGILHLVVPKADNLANFCQYIAREMKSANEDEIWLRVIVGVLVDEEATPECLYNTEDCPLFDHYKYPWARSFCMLEGQYSVEHFDPDYSAFVPDVRAKAGKKLLLVTLDSRSRESGSLPMPQELGFVDSDPEVVGAIAPEETEEKEVILGFDKQDPRALSLIRDSGASTYRMSGGCHLVSLPFADSEKAQEFVENLRSEYTDVFCMTKENLYSPRAFTLTCHSPVLAHELYPLLDAVEVMPLGRNKYRFTCVHDIMDCARVLWKENKYKKNDHHRYQALRDDQNHYVWLNRKKLELQKYFRRLPPAKKAGNAQQASRRLHWYSVEGLPRGVSDEMLKVGLSGCEQLRQATVKEWRINRSPYFPTVWVGLETVLSKLNPVVKNVFQTVAMILPGTEPAVGARPLGEVPESEHPLQVLRNFGKSDFYVPAKGTSKFLQSYAKRPRPLPARNSVFGGKQSWAQTHMAGKGSSNMSRKATESKNARSGPTERGNKGTGGPNPARQVDKKSKTSSKASTIRSGDMMTREYWSKRKEHKDGQEELPSSGLPDGQQASDQKEEWKRVLPTGRKTAGKGKSKRLAGKDQQSSRAGDRSRSKGAPNPQARNRSSSNSTKRRRRGSGAKDQEPTQYQILQKRSWGPPGPRPSNELQRPRDVIPTYFSASATNAGSSERKSQ